MSRDFDLTAYGLHVKEIIRNAPPGRLYEEAVLFDRGVITASGALATNSGAKTGRSPKDKRIVDHPDSSGNIWWGPVNIRQSEASFTANRQRAVDYLNTRDRLYVVDGYVGWDVDYRLKTRVICERPYHALFMHNMLIRPTMEELGEYGEPDYVVINAGAFPADPTMVDVSSQTSVCLSFERREFVILGTQYAGEMKKGLFTVMNYLMPAQGVLSMHCAANEGHDGDVTLFFGLSGTGKTTLSADPRRKLIGDDEHVWTDDGVFNIEGGCYAKCIGLNLAKEPQIHRAIRFGSVLENVVIDPRTREVQFASAALTQNTRACYPIEFIPAAKIPCVGGHPRNIVFLTCDAFGVLPPVSRLTPGQAMYHYISGYSAKVAGTEVGITEPEATFSACFGAPFLVWHPTKYAGLLAEKMQRRQSAAWLVNTGWSGGAYPGGERISLSYTRAIIDAIHSGSLVDAPMEADPHFGVLAPLECPGVPAEVLRPARSWADEAAYGRAARKLAQLFQKNFAQYADAASDEIRAAAPRC
jgi:phosphoenolpyruvate carboxykinase (ATP)